MTFLNPAGLWLLLGIPFLIVLYIIRSKHKDRNVSSTYIWKLSDRFMKKRVHLYAISRIILLILEILAVAAAAFLLARPAVEHLPEQDYILVFDASASMQVSAADGKTRFDEAVERARKLAEKVDDGHRFSIIVAGEDAVCPLRYSTSKDAIELSLNALTCDLGECGDDKAFSLVNEIAAKTAHPKVVFYTDRSCANTGSPDTEVVNVSGALGEKNLCAAGLRVRRVLQENEFVGTIVSDNYNGTVLAVLTSDEDDNVLDVEEVDCHAGETVEVVFRRQNAEPFTWARMSVVATDDGFKDDDSYILFPDYVRQRRIEVVSESPYFLQKAISLIPGCDVKYVPSLDRAEFGDYDLYVFDCESMRAGETVAELPQDAPVILMNTEVEAIGLKLGEERTEEAVALREKDADLPLVADFNASETVVGAYRVLDVSAAWTTLLSCADEPVAAVKTNSKGYAIVAFSFDFHDSNLPMQGKFAQLMSELLDYSAPALLDSVHFPVGETIVLRAEKQGALNVKTPEGRTRMPAVKDGAATFTPYTAGVYTVEEAYGEDAKNEVSVFVHIPSEESVRAEIAELAPVSAAVGAEETTEAKLEIYIWMAVLLLFVLICEWGVFLYEQF